MTGASASVVIASRGRPAMLLEAVRSVLAGDPLPLEIVVVDQSRRPQLDVAAMGRVDGCEVRYIHAPGVGVSRARNRGIREARGTLILFIDDDVLVGTGWCRAMVDALGGDIQAVSGRVSAAQPEHVGAFVPSTNEAADRTVHVVPGATDVLFTNNAGIRRSALDSVGGFDERLGPGTRFPAAEDNDLGYRLLRAGIAIAYEPGAVVVHRAWRHGDRYLGLRHRYGRGQGAFYAKHRAGDPTIARRLRGDLRRMARRAVRHLLRQPRRSLGDLAYALGVLEGSVLWSIERKRGGSG